MDTNGKGYIRFKSGREIRGWMLWEKDGVTVVGPEARCKGMMAWTPCRSQVLRLKSLKGMVVAGIIGR